MRLSLCKKWPPEAISVFTIVLPVLPFVFLNKALDIVSLIQCIVGPRKLHFAILSAQDPAVPTCSNILHRKSIWGEGRRVKRTQKPRYTITLISACLWAQYQPAEHRHCSAQSFLSYCSTGETLLHGWLIQQFNYLVILHRWIIYCIHPTGAAAHTREATQPKRLCSQDC